MKVLIIGAGAMPAHYFVPEIHDHFILHLPSPGGFTVDNWVIDEFSDSMLKLAERFIETGKAAEKAALQMADICRQLNEMSAIHEKEQYFAETKQTYYRPYNGRLKKIRQDIGNFMRCGFRSSGRLARGRI